MAFDGNTASQDSLAVFLSASEHDFVDLAIGILRHYRAPGTIGPHRTATVADGEVATRQAVFVLNQVLRPLDEIVARAACFQHPREVGLAEDIAEEVFRIAGNPAVALSDRPLRVHRNELIGTVLFPDAG
jgi:hypothetical protein